MAAWLQGAWGQSCVVDNKSGAGVIGSNEVVKAAPDGHIALMGNIGPQSIAYSLYRNMPYGPQSLAPVSCVITAPNVLVVHPSVPAKTVPEFVAWLTPELVPICETMPELRPFDVSTWFGVLLPAATPKPIVAAFNEQMKSWLDDPKTRERFTQMAGFPAYGTSAEFDTFVTAQISQWKGVIDKEGLQLDVN